MGNENDDAPPVITLSPMPPTRGGKLLIKCTPGATILLDWTPAGTPTSVKLDASGQATITVPANANYLIASDQGGGAAPVATGVS